MKTPRFAFALGAGIVGAVVSYGEEPSSLARKFITIANESKIGYVIGVQLPKGAKPVLLPRCEDDADASLLRVVLRSDGKRELVPWETKKQAADLFWRAEEAFSKQDWKTAQALYSKVLELDSDYGPAWLFSGDVAYRMGDFEEALRRYRKAIELDKTNPTAHLFAGDALLQLGRQEEALREYLLALAYRPTYRLAEAKIRSLGAKIGYFFFRMPFDPPDGVFPAKKGENVHVPTDPKAKDAVAWLSFSLCQAVWRYEPEYRKDVANRQEPFSLERDAECIQAFWDSWGDVLKEEAAKKLEEKPEGQEKPAITAEDVSERGKHVARVLVTNTLPGYVLVEYLGMRCSRAMRFLPDAAIELAVEYLSKACFVADARRTGTP